MDRFIDAALAVYATVVLSLLVTVLGLTTLDVYKHWASRAQHLGDPCAKSQIR